MIKTKQMQLLDKASKWGTLFITVVSVLYFGIRIIVSLF